MSQDATSRLTRITTQDWALAAISLLFTLAGLFIVGRDFSTGVVTLVLFGLGLVHAVSVILRKRRAQRRRALTAGVIGGVPIRQSRTRMALLGGALLAIGVTHIAFTTRAVQVVLGGLLLGIGVAVVIAVVLGRLSGDYLQFDPAGITFGQPRGKAIVPWDAVTRVAAGELVDNPVVLVSVDAQAVVAAPPAHLPALLRQMARCRGGPGADFVLMTASYGIDAPVLLAALQRYVSQPAARGELACPPRLPAGPPAS